MYKNCEGFNDIQKSKTKTCATLTDAYIFNLLL